MRFSSSAAALLALPSLAFAVSLADFKPRVDNLPSNCQTVYTVMIAGCSSSDFTSGTCSAGCIKGLQSMTSFVQSACNGVSIQGSNIISSFLNGNGPGSVCPNLMNSNSGSSSSPSSAAQSTASSAATSTGASTGTTSTGTMSTGTTTGTSTTASSSPTTSTVIGIMTVTSGATTSTSSSTASSTTSSGMPAQYTLASGGGSPFDTPGSTMNNGASGRALFSTGSALAVVVLALIPAALL